jgi:hypothetical protein
MYDFLGSGMHGCALSTSTDLNISHPLHVVIYG